ncbi:MAG: TRAP transporter large permease subunit, partial [Porticoccaceae bacterium]
VMLLFPVFMPVVLAMGIDLVWLGILVMVALELGLLTPPFGMLLFVVKGVLGNQYTDFEIYKSVLPFIVMQVVVLLLILFNPGILHLFLGLIQ